MRLRETQLLPTTSWVLDMLKHGHTMFNGAKKSSHILFASSDTEKAQEVLDQINAGTLDFAEAAAVLHRQGFCS